MKGGTQSWLTQSEGRRPLQKITLGLMAMHKMKSPQQSPRARPGRGKTPKKTPRKPVSSVKDPVEVYCRSKPIGDGQDTCLDIINSNTIQLRPPEGSHAYRNGNYKETQHMFKFVFAEDCSQKALFDHIALPLLEDLIHGKNALLFMYGVTGSGKTHTMQGSPQNGGVLPRSLDVLFNTLGDLQARKYVFKPDRVNGMDVQTEADAMLERQKRELMPPPVAPRTPRTPGTPKRTRKEQIDFSQVARVPDVTRLSSIDEDNNYAVFVSYVEIYNNMIYDLLEDVPVSLHAKYSRIRDDFSSLTSRILREDANRNMYVAMCTEVEVKTTEEAYTVFLRGQSRRKVAHTQLNTESSRSHSVFNIKLVQAPLDSLGQEVLQDKSQICVSQLSLVDLAGSERTHRTNNTGDRLKEAGSINASLMTLRTCIETLRENQTEGANKMVPYRTSKLTHLFKNYFDGEGKVRMVVCVNPDARDYDETIHVMKFAEITQEVQVARPTEVRFDIGLTPGRRKANEEYRRLLAESDGKVPPPPPPILSLGPPFPLLQISDPSDDTTLPNLIAFLAEREKRRKIMEEDLARKQGAFRAMLVEADHELDQLRAANAKLNSKLSSKTRECDRLEKRVRSLEQDNHVLQHTHQMYEADKRSMETELTEKEKKIQMETQERARLKQALKGAVSSQRDKWEKECAKRVRQTELKMQTEMWVREEKLRQLKEIVQGHEEKDSARKAEKQVLAESFNRSRSPPPVHRSQAPPVRLRHRRSRSTSNNVWIDHQPAEILDTETVLKPTKGKNTKRVSQPSVKDIKSTDNYMLTHQEEDSAGEIETKIFKAEVIPTRGGGRSVQFTDVEKLKTEDPLSQSVLRSKRPAEDDPEQYSGEWTDVETRVSVHSVLVEADCLIA
ncbi:kinesin-like protein KIF23 [Diadema antillarum]|uniref:kinesin-like protein KIF23 n=1 Tax=Diadema antillarum TaxID=105358 RepID=UPI003A860E98